jgi:mercuric ion transport protein
MKERGFLAGSVAAALLASACCIGPLVLGAVGLGSLGVAGMMGPFRPWLLGLTGGFLAAGFFLAYRPLAPECAGAACAPPNRTLQRTMLWVTTAVAIALVTFPSWGGATRSRVPAPNLAQTAGPIVALNVSGMTCADCAPEIEGALRRVPGVVSARVDYATASADVQLASRHVDAGLLLAAVRGTGYRAALRDAAPASGR